MLFSKPGGTNNNKTSLNFHDNPPPDIKRSTTSNISKNSNHTSQIGTIPLENVVFDMKPVLSIPHTQEANKEQKIVSSPPSVRLAPVRLRPVNPVSLTPVSLIPANNPLTPASLTPAPLTPAPLIGSMQVPFPPLRTKYTEVVFESNLRDSDKPQIVNFPIEKIVPVVKNIIRTDRIVEKHVEEYFIANKISMAEIKNQLTPPLHELIEMQQSLQKKELQTFIETFVQEKYGDHLSKEDVSTLVGDECRLLMDSQLSTKEYVTKSEVVEMIEERKKQPECITNSETKEYVTQTELNEFIEQKEYVTKPEVQEVITDAMSELKTKEYVTKTEVIELIEERKENYAAIISEVLELNAKEYVTKKEVVELIDERQAVNGKLYALNMAFLVEKYVTEMIERGENAENAGNAGEEHDDEPKTKFEEIIQPSVARIIHRVLKYDQSHNEEEEARRQNVSVNFEVDEVYDMARQEKSHFTDCDAKASIYNPMYSLNESTNTHTYNVAADDAIVEMGSVYKGEETGSFQYENELRKVGEDRRWNRFGNGIETGSVIDLFLDKNNRKIYIVGNFKFVNRVPLENIAVYDLNEKKWKHVGEGIPQVATAIAVDEENEIVYVGGVFSKVGKGDCEVQANNVAAYHVKENKWVALGEGLNRDCSSILFDKNTKKLYAGGSFTQSGSKILKYVAVYDIEDKAWQPLKGGSVNGSCRIVLKPNEDDLYLGGLFTHAGNDDLHVSYVARYNLKNDTWHSLGGGLQGYCNAISYDCTKNKLYVGGTFTSVGSIDASINANHIAEYDIENNSWNDMDGGLNNIVQSIFYDANNECVYVGGTFTHSFENNIQLNHIARYDLRESKWCCLENHFPNKTHDGTDNVGLNGNCKVMSVDNKSLFIAGSFQIAGNITANSIVRYSLNL